MVLYLDSSAIVKLVVAEAESAALGERLNTEESLVSSAIALAEVPLALGRLGAEHFRAGQRLLSSLSLITVDDPLLEKAATLQPAVVRTLDAIHVASALALGDDLDALVTYDRRTAEAAEWHDIAVESPA